MFQKSRTQYNKKYYKNWKRKNKEKLKIQAIENASNWGQFENTDEVFNELVVPVPYFTQELQEYYIDNKFQSLFKKGPEKLLSTFIKIYFAETHKYHPENLYLGLYGDNMKQFSSNKFERYFELLLGKESGFYVYDAQGEANSYYLLFDVEWGFLKWNKSLEYINLIASKKFDEARDFVIENDLKSYNATTLRMSNLLQRGFKINDLKKDFTDEINACIIKKININKRVNLSNNEVSKIAKKMVEEYLGKEVEKITDKQFLISMKKIKSITLKEVLDLYEKKYEKKVIQTEKNLERYRVHWDSSNELITKSTEKNLRKYRNYLNDVKKVKESIVNDEIIYTELKMSGRDYNLLTQINKQLREVILSFLGFTYEVDLKSAIFQLYKKTETKLFGTSWLEKIYDELDDYSMKYAEEIRNNKNSKNLQVKKVRKNLKFYFTSIFNGGNVEFLPDYLTFVSNPNEIKALGKKIHEVHNKLKFHLIETKLNFLKKDNKKINSDNILYYDYIQKEQRVINELKKHFDVSFRVHDALYVQSSLKEVKNAINSFNYDVKYNRITSKYKELILKL